MWREGPWRAPTLPTQLSYSTITGRAQLAAPLPRCSACPPPFSLSSVSRCDLSVAGGAIGKQSMKMRFPVSFPSLMDKRTKGSRKRWRACCAMLSCLSAGAIGRAAPRRATFSPYGGRTISIFFQLTQFLETAVANDEEGVLSPSLPSISLLT